MIIMVDTHDIVCGGGGGGEGEVATGYPRNEDISERLLIRTPPIVPATWRSVKTTPEMRAPPL